jgi:F0F1-type ATP synthase membrane subunit b/b'
MSSSIDIYPFTDTEGLVRFGAQVVIFLVGLYLTHKLIIKPALRLHNERVKRTQGNNELAKKNLEKANNLEHEYFSRLKEGADEARRHRAEEISAANQIALKIVTDTQQKSNEYVKSIRDQLHKETHDAKLKLAPLLDEIIQSINSKLGLLVSLFIFSSLFFFHSQSAFAATVDEPLIPSFWYSIFWPYFQFFVFIIAIFFFAKNPIKNILEQRRDDFRAKLSEAHEAVHLAERRLREYEEKVRSLESEINALNERNMEDAKLERDRIIAEANQTASIILKDSERIATELINTSKEEIKKELFSLALHEFEKRLNQENFLRLDTKLKKEVLDNIKNVH